MFQSEERRMHVRAYNYWVSLLGNRTLPSIEDLNPEDTEDFSAHSVLLDFSMGLENPAILYLGSALRDECGITGPIERVDEVPARSLLTRLTDHYLQIIANAAPVGFEAEFINQRDASIRYRGILMPFSSDDETIDFIYGVINWKEAVSDSLRDQLGAEMEAALAAPATHSNAAIWADGPSATSDFADENEREDDYLDDDLMDITDHNALSTIDAEPADMLEEAQSSEADDGDYGFDEVAPAETAQVEAPSDINAEQDSDALGSLDDLMAMPGEDSAPPAAEVQPGAEAPLDELDLSAFMMTEDASAPASVPSIDRTDDGLDFSIDDLISDIGQPETPQPTATSAEETAVLQLREALEELPDVDDILSGMEFDSPSEPAPQAPVAERQSSELNQTLDLDDLLGDIGIEDFARDAPQGSAPVSEEEEVFSSLSADMISVGGDLADLLAEARNSAAEVRDCDARSRAALYRAIGHAHDFALSAQAASQDYDAMLEDAGITVQERSPMTAVIKLVFGADYDKTRIAEYALALDHANASGLMHGELAQLLMHYRGGLKGLVQEMRTARKGAAGQDAIARPIRRLERAARRLQRAKAVEVSSLPFGDLGLAVVVARREEDGSISLVAGVGLEDKAAQKVMIAASKATRAR